MPQVVVTIDEKTYRIACGEGEEAHLTMLATEVDRRVSELKAGFGQIGDLRLTVMAAIMAADELHEAHRRITELEGRLDESSALSGASEEVRQQERAAVAGILDETAASLERIAARLAEG